MLGAEETASEKTVDVIKEVGPSLLSSVSKALSKDAKKPDAPTTPSPGMPGWQIALIAVAAAAGLGGIVYLGVRK